MAKVKEVIFERTLNAPLEKVWQVWTDSKIIKKWWGPDNTFVPDCDIDLRVGGRIYIVMEAGEGMGEFIGMRWPMEGKYTAVEKNAKLSYDAKAWTEGAEKTTEIETTTDIILVPEEDKTKIKVRAVIHKMGPDAKMAVEGMEWGYNQQFDKLEKFLAI